jgi:glucose-6-phosphate 1-epimerase
MLAELRRHALPGVAEIVEGAGRLPAVKVTAGQATGMVYLHGAHVAAWKPAGFEEVLWMSAKSTFEEGRPIRGGVPICFPWFGPKPDAPAHGFVRLKAWELESIRQEAAGVTVTLAYAGSAADEAVRKYWPHDFVLRQRVTFGTELTMALELTNRGGAPLRAEEALHTYFSLGDVRQARTAGLSGARYIDKTDGMKEKLQEGDIAITAETDRVYLETRSAVHIMTARIAVTGL